MVEPAAGAGPLVLALYLHGDGAGAHKSGSALRTMAPWLDAARGLGVSVLAPNGCSWWQSPSHDCASAGSTSDRAADNTKALAGAFEALRARLQSPHRQDLLQGRPAARSSSPSSGYPSRAGAARALSR